MGIHEMTQVELMPACCYLGLRNVQYYGQYKACQILMRDEGTYIVECEGRQHRVPEAHVYVGASSGPSWITDYGGTHGASTPGSKRITSQPERLRISLLPLYAGQCVWAYGPAHTATGALRG